MNALIPVWIIGAPAAALVFFSLAFRGPSAMSGSRARHTGDVRVAGDNFSEPLRGPKHPDSPYRQQ